MDSLEPEFDPPLAEVEAGRGAGWSPRVSSGPHLVGIGFVESVVEPNRPTGRPQLG